jgi:hypothetical protein
MAFHDDPRLPLQQVLEYAAHLAAGAEAAGAVLWLDGLPPERAGELADLALDTLPDVLRIAVTLTSRSDDEPPPAARLETFLDRHAVLADLAAISPAERRALRDCDTYAELRPVLDEGHDVLMGRFMVSWEEIRRALTRDSEQSTDRVALLHAVTDWYRLGLDTHRLLTADILKHLFTQYRREIAGLAPDAPVPVGTSRAIFSDMDVEEGAAYCPPAGAAQGRGVRGRLVGVIKAVGGAVRQQVPGGGEVADRIAGEQVAGVDHAADGAVRLAAAGACPGFPPRRSRNAATSMSACPLRAARVRSARPARMPWVRASSSSACSVARICRRGSRAMSFCRAAAMHVRAAAWAASLARVGVSGRSWGW